MSTSDDLNSLVRSVRARLESLRRAGIDRIPAPEIAPRVVIHGDDAPNAVEADRPQTARDRLEPEREAPAAPARRSPVVAVAGSMFGEQALDGPELPHGERESALSVLRSEVAACTRCEELARTRTQTVFGVGSPTAELMFIGEAPGADEDRLGEPFVGRAGQLLTDMITKGMGLRREDVYIANILKSRPPENRTPLPTEIANCIGYLERQIAIIRPRFLCLLGKTAAGTLLDTALPMGRLRGKWHRYRGLPAVVTWHPAYLLRNPAAKREAWEDLQMLMSAMGLKIPGRMSPE